MGFTDTSIILPEHCVHEALPIRLQSQLYLVQMHQFHLQCETSLQAKVDKAGLGTVLYMPWISYNACVNYSLQIQIAVDAYCKNEKNKSNFSFRVFQPYYFKHSTSIVVEGKEEIPHKYKLYRPNFSKLENKQVTFSSRSNLYDCAQLAFNNQHMFKNSCI